MTVYIVVDTVAAAATVSVDVYFVAVVVVYANETTTNEWRRIEKHGSINDVTCNYRHITQIMLNKQYNEQQFYAMAQSNCIG